VLELELRWPGPGSRKEEVEKRKRCRRESKHTLPQNGQKYLECCETSIFLMILRREAP
jgi:hypothetical protein